MSLENGSERDRPDAMERLDKLEEVVEEQQEIIEEQRNEIEDQRSEIQQLKPSETENKEQEQSDGVSRRGLIATGGLLTLLGLGPSAVTAQPSGSVGTSSNPVDLYPYEVFGQSSLNIFNNGNRVIRTVGQGSDPPNLILGSGYNEVQDGPIGVTIAGGGPSDTSNPSTTNNRVYDDYCTIGGGGDNQAGKNDGNTATSNYSTVSGGKSNTASGGSATVGGGLENTVSGSLSTVGGGWSNTVNDSYATIGGGQKNEAIAMFATIAGGGPSDTLNGDTTNNVVYDDYGTIGGGGNNQAGNADGDKTTAEYATVSGGHNNQATGYLSTVCGGSTNFATGLSSIIVGGQNNSASGSWSFATGRYASADHDGSFVFGDSSTTTISSNAADETRFQTDLVTQQTLSFTDSTTQRTSGPIAKGFIDQDGSRVNSVNVDSVIWDSTNTLYRIELTNTNYVYYEYHTSVTSGPGHAVTWETDSVNGDLLVIPSDGSKHDFSFVTFELPTNLTQETSP